VTRDCEFWSVSSSTMQKRDLIRWRGGEGYVYIKQIAT
jgi:hypothetical protein